MTNADDIRKRTMESHLFEDNTNQQSSNMNAAVIQNRRRGLQSQIQFGDDSQSAPRGFSQKPLPPLPDPSSSPQNLQNNRILPDNYSPPPQYSQINNENKIANSFRPTQYQPSSQSRPQPIQGPNFPTPHQARFIQTPIKAAALPKYDGLIQNTELPNLSPFPDFSINLDQSFSPNFQFHIKPMTSSGARSTKKLNPFVGNEMAKMREEFEKDSFDFQGRLAKIKPITLIQPVYQMPAQDYIPPISSRSSLSTPNTVEY